jgi:hypothetical protein
MRHDDDVGGDVLAVESEAHTPMCDDEPPPNASRKMRAGRRQRALTRTLELKVESGELEAGVLTKQLLTPNL